MRTPRPRAPTFNRKLPRSSSRWSVMRAGTEREPGAFDLAASATASDLASRLPTQRHPAAEAWHFIPMEQPERVAEEIAKLAAASPWENRRAAPANPERHKKKYVQWPRNILRGLPSTSSRLASIPCRIAPMCSAAPDGLSSINRGGLESNHGHSSLHPELRSRGVAKVHEKPSDFPNRCPSPAGPRQGHAQIRPRGVAPPSE